jgi:hypothetical protein
MYCFETDAIKGIGEIRHRNDFNVSRIQDTTDASERVILHVTDKRTKEGGLLVVRRLLDGGLSEAGKFYHN